MADTESTPSKEMRGFKHGWRYTKTYMAWLNLRSRCNNPRNTFYHRYGGRGITYDPRWNQFENFLADMGECPPEHQIDRTNNDGNYEKSNCRWVTTEVNANNRSNNHLFEYEGKTLTLAELARATGMNREKLRNRLECGYTVEQAITRPTRSGISWPLYAYQGQQYTAGALGALVGIHPATMASRLQRYGMTVEEAVSRPIKNLKRSVR